MDTTKQDEVKPKRKSPKKKEAAVTVPAEPIVKPPAVAARKPGRSPVDLLLIQSHPTDVDASCGKLFTSGYAAVEVRRALKNAGIDEEGVYLTTMVKHALGAKKSKPSTEDIDMWRADLEEEIAKYQPRFIIPLGAEPLKWVMKSNVSLSDYLGEINDSHYGKIIANYSPGLIMADPTKRPEFLEIFKYIAAVVSGEISYTEYTWTVVNEPAENLKILQNYIDRNCFQLG